MSTSKHTNGKKNQTHGTAQSTVFAAEFHVPITFGTIDFASIPLTLELIIPDKSTGVELWLIRVLCFALKSLHKILKLAANTLIRDR